MTWLEHIDKNMLKHDLIKVITFMVIAHVLTVKLTPNTSDNKIVFDDTFLKTTFYTLIGFAVFYVVVEPMVIGSIK